MAKTQAVYKDREQLDNELLTEISEILSAEAEAKRIVEQAEEAAKAIQLDAAAQERTLREAYSRDEAAYRDEAVSSAILRAEKESATLIKKAEEDGAALVKQKQSAIVKRAQELFKSLGGK